MILGTLRLHTSPDLIGVLDRARQHGLSVDTADVYGDRQGDTEGRLPADLRVTTKVGLVRDGSRWTPNGTVKHLDAALTSALARGPRDAVLLHAVDPKVGVARSWRVLLKARDDGRIARVGLCNVRVHELREAMALGTPDIVQVAVSPFDDDALFGGLVQVALDAGIEVQAHSPLGGHRRKGHAHRALVPIAREHGISAERLALAWLGSLGVSPVVGWTRVETLDDGLGPVPEEAVSAARIALPATSRARRTPRPSGDREIVLVMGLAGAGKTTLTEGYVARGHLRFNRDERGGTLSGLLLAMDEALGSGARALVADNTWLDRPKRGRVVDLAARHDARVHVMWVDTPPDRCGAQAVARILERDGVLPEPDALRAGDVPWRFGPRVIQGHVGLLEPPSEDEGFTLERVDAPQRPAGSRSGTVAGVTALEAGVPLPRPLFVIAWTPDAAHQARLDAALAGHTVDAVVTCSHPAGPPICWCRPPLPGLLELLRVQHDLDPATTTVVGGPTERALARASGFGFRTPSDGAADGRANAERAPDPAR